MAYVPYVLLVVWIMVLWMYIKRERRMKESGGWGQYVFGYQVRCAWCGTLMRGHKDSGQVSHGICLTCVKTNWRKS